MQRFLFAVDGVDRRFAVIDAQGGFQRGGVGGIQLKRHIHRFLQFPDHAREHGDFIHARIADVDVQNLRARVHLRFLPVGLMRSPMTRTPEISSGIVGVQRKLP